MADLDAVLVGQLAARVGLVTPDQLQEAKHELGISRDPEELLRIFERKGQLTPWQSAKLLKGDVDGYFMGGYRILYKISSGSFGRVYRAEDIKSGMIVAIKVLRARWMEKPKTIELFEREGKVGMTMHHPNIVEILSVKCDPKAKQYYIVMEFVEGGNLREILKLRQKLDPLTALRILEDAAAGLTYAASRGISHRDMKLTNVLISSSGRAKLVDFGLAGLKGHLHKESGDKQVDRTVDYAGLEKATNAPQGDFRSDIYFLGCIAYELLTGRAPLEKSKNPAERMRSARFQAVKAMGNHEVEAPPSVFHLVEKMMALYPSDRFQTASQTLDAIRDVRKELEGQVGTVQVGPKSLFILEKNLKLQDALREKFKEHGYRVLISAEPNRALDRYRQQPFDAIILDAGTVGEEGVLYFDRIMREAKDRERLCAGIIILSEDQQSLSARIPPRASVALLVRPVTVKQLQKKLTELFAVEDKPAKTEGSTNA
jgi:serine/threonine protein kinase